MVFNTEALSPLFERVIIASGTSNRQTKALASSVRETVRKRGLPVLRTEGEANGEWIIVDCGAAVAHIMQPAIRDYYHLEEIWGVKPVRLKGGGDVRATLPKASEPQAAPGVPARKPAAKSAGAAPAEAPAPRRAASSGTANGKAAAKKAAKGKPATRKAAPRKAAQKRPAGRKPADKKPTQPTTAKTPASPARSTSRPAAGKSAAKKRAGAGKRAAAPPRKSSTRTR